MVPKWLEWVKELQAISQNGLEFANDEFDVERYKAVRKVASEILAVHSSLEPEAIENMFIKESGYATPKVDVRGVVFKDNKILLVKEVSDGGWTLPGGWADPNETPSYSVEREVFEESGFIVKAKKILAVFDRDKQGHTYPYPFHIYKLFFLCELIGGEKKLSYETDGVDIFGEEEIPVLSERRTLKHQIKLFFEHYRNPELPAVFD
ncbi:MAG: NUDIX hydrolase [Ignavibacteriaceae bacterium]